MRNWSLNLQAPLTLTLAADTRYDGFNPEDDQIWELTVSKDEPVGLELQSTYGLRAKSVRILPAFSLSGQMRADPRSFHSEPVIQSWLPDYISAVWDPYPQLAVKAEYWVRNSSLLAGRYTLLNRTEEALQPGLRLYAILEPGGDDQPYIAAFQDGVEILTGRCGKLTPIIFLQGGARSEPAPYPALGVHTILPPGSRHTWLWAHCGAKTVRSGFQRCRELAKIAWEAELASSMLGHRDFIEVDSGIPDWDAALWAAQRETKAVFLRPSHRLRSAVPVASRSIKDGASLEEGLPAWEPANPWASHYAALQSIPVDADRVKGYIEALLRLQQADGFIPALTDFSHLNEGWLFPPLLARLCWRIFESTDDRAFLSTAYRPLKAFFDRWFHSDQDRDGDGFPEWTHVQQAGFESWPAFSPWYPWSQGLEISKAETIDLACHLIMEGQALTRIAETIQRDDGLDELQGKLDMLMQRANETWKDGVGYQHVDYAIHDCVGGKRLAVRRGDFSLDVGSEFDPAVRVLLRVEGPEKDAGTLLIKIHSRGRRGPGRVEALNFSKFGWFLNQGLATSEKPSAEIERIDLSGLSRKFRTTVSLADYSREDATLLLPLAAGITLDDRARFLVQQILLDSERYWQAHGIADIPRDDPAYSQGEDDQGAHVDMLLNHWLGEGLLRYGYMEEAAELFSRLMLPVIHSLKHKHAFSAQYSPEGERLSSEPHSISGLAPLALFMKILGVDLISPKKVRIHPGNPFPNPVRLRWRGLEVICHEDRTLVKFPDGGVVEVTGEYSQVIEQVDQM